MKLEIVSIERRVIDPVAAMPVQANPIRAIGKVSTIPQEVPATNTARLDVEARGLQSEAQYAQAGTPVGTQIGVSRLTAVAVSPLVAELGTQDPLTKELRDAALNQVDLQLVEEGLIDEVGGSVTETTRQEFGYTQTTSLPTAGVIVKGCLDTCSICEPEVEKKIQYELDRMDLENQLLKRQIELLEKSQEYRCCPRKEREEDN